MNVSFMIYYYVKAAKSKLNDKVLHIPSLFMYLLRKVKIPKCCVKCLRTSFYWIIMFSLIPKSLLCYVIHKIAFNLHSFFELDKNHTKKGGDCINITLLGTVHPEYSNLLADNRFSSLAISVMKSEIYLLSIYLYIHLFIQIFIHLLMILLIDRLTDLLIYSFLFVSSFLRSINPSNIP